MGERRFAPRLATAGGDRLLMALAAALAVSTVVAVVAPLLGHEPRVYLWAGEGYAAWTALMWPAFLAGVLWRSRAQIRRLRHRLDRTDTRLADMAATTREWTWEADSRLVISSCGPAVARLLGRAPSEMVGRSMFDFIDDADVPRARSIFAAAVENWTGWDDVALTWLHADGHKVVMIGNAVPVLGTHGGVAGFRGARTVVSSERLTPALVDAARHIQRIIEGEAVTVALQPVIDLTTHEWIAAEALARFTDGSSPSTVFPMAEEVGRAADLELLTLSRALDALSVLPEGVALSVNASPVCVLDQRFADALAEHRDILSRVILEITEHSAVASYPEIQAVLDPLRRLGLRLAVDDTGAGYASFHHILNLRPDIIKIDRSLIIDIDRDLARRSFITAIMLLALDLGASVTAEGIERPEELDALTTLGVDHAQGYLICRPSTDADEWERWRHTHWIERPYAALT
ncbi:MAG TPA: EAL domain-containing protein [Acidimicrobiales bacterium]|nr:EAL domain-containing protein [Acidimicrobiales bacterium]